MKPDAPNLSRAGRIYVCAVGVSGILLLAHCVTVLLRQGVPYQWGVFAALALLSGRLTVKVPGVKAFFAVSEIFIFSCVLLFGPEAGAVTLALDALVLGWHQRMGLLKTSFNLGTLSLTSWVAGTVFFRWSGVEPLFGHAAPTLALIGPLALLAIELLPHQHRAHRRRDRVRDAGPARSESGARTSSGSRPATRRAHRSRCCSSARSSR